MFCCGGLKFPHKTQKMCSTLGTEVRTRYIMHRQCSLYSYTVLRQSPALDFVRRALPAFLDDNLFVHIALERFRVSRFIDRRRVTAYPGMKSSDRRRWRVFLARCIRVLVTLRSRRKSRSWRNCASHASYHALWRPAPDKRPSSDQRSSDC